MPRVTPLLFALSIFAVGLTIGPQWGRSADAMAADFELPGSVVSAVGIPAGLSTEEVRDVVILTVLERKYTLTEKGENYVVTRLVNHGHEAIISYLINADTITIYCEGYAVNSQGERRKPETPLNWINNVRSDLGKRLQFKLATK